MVQASATNPSSGIHPNTNATMPHLAARLALRFAAMTLLIAALLFMPAGTVRWWQGWTFLALLVTSALAVFLFFLRVDPHVVERRLRAKEQVHAQKQIMLLAYLVFAGLLTLPGLDHRLGWSQRWLGAEPMVLELFSLAILPLTMLAVAWVLWTNRYAGRTIRVEEGQQVITSGPYRLVRNPMYAFSAMMWGVIPLTLGSYVTLPAFALTLFFYVPRILNEEKILRGQLPGYSEYCETTRWRIVPLVW